MIPAGYYDVLEHHCFLTKLRYLFKLMFFAATLENSPLFEKFVGFGKFMTLRKNCVSPEFVLMSFVHFLMHSVISLLSFSLSLSGRQKRFLCRIRIRFRKNNGKMFENLIEISEQFLYV